MKLQYPPQTVPSQETAVHEARVVIAHRTIDEAEPGGHGQQNEHNVQPAPGIRKLDEQQQGQRPDTQQVAQTVFGDDHDRRRNPQQALPRRIVVDEENGALKVVFDILQTA